MQVAASVVLASWKYCSWREFLAVLEGGKSRDTPGVVSEGSELTFPLCCCWAHLQLSSFSPSTRSDARQGRSYKLIQPVLIAFSLPPAPFSISSSKLHKTCLRHVYETDKEGWFQRHAPGARWSGSDRQNRIFFQFYSNIFWRTWLLVLREI